MKSFSESYKAAGVDIEAGYESVERIKSHVKKTFTEGVLGGIGSFGGLFELGKGMENPVLVSGTDGVGTKLKLAFIMDKHDTIGQDCVAMCVNDIICAGAKPLIFLDYLAVGKNVPAQIEEVVKGVADGCVLGGCSLVGGETAEMPGFYAEGEYDLAGFSVGVVDKKNIIDGSKMKDGDVLIGLASSGIHSNGYSLVRKVFGIDDTTTKADLSETISELGGISLGEELLKPTKIYVKPVLALMEEVTVKAISHITGGGFYENIPRMLNDGIKACVKKGSWTILPIFDYMSKKGNIPERDMFNTYNMGIGMVIAVGKEDAEKAIDILKKAGETAYIIGSLANGEKGVEVC
jgi:phosphoribosylaminoimidazole synthetase